MGEQNAAKALFLPQLYCQMKKPATAKHLHGAKHAKDPKKKKEKQNPNILCAKAINKTSFTVHFSF